MNQHGYIYRVTNLVNGTTYVGQRRGEFRGWYLGSGRLLRRAVLKYGAQQFQLEFIQSAFDQPTLDRLEQHFIAEARKVGRTYNVRDGGLGSLFNGKGPMFGKKFSEASKRKMSESHSGEKNGNYGRKFPTQNIGRVLSEETKRKISASSKGKSRNQGVKRTPEQIEAMRNRAKAQPRVGSFFVNGGVE